MYNALPREYGSRFMDYFKKRKEWLLLVLYDRHLTACVLFSENKSNSMKISDIKTTSANGIENGRIINTNKAKKAMEEVLGAAMEHSEAGEKMVWIGLDIPSLVLTPKHWADNSFIKTPCQESLFQRIFSNVLRESTVEGLDIIEIIPRKMVMDNRIVEDPIGITGQLKMEMDLISISSPNHSDFKQCVSKAGYKSNGFFSNFSNMCHAYSTVASNNEPTMLIDLKYNSTDLFLFAGDQPLLMKSFNQGLNDILIKPLSLAFNEGEKEVIGYFTKYCSHGHESEEPVIGKNEILACPEGFAWWELDQFIKEQLKTFLHATDGIRTLLNQVQIEYHFRPQRLRLTGEGVHIPKIEQFFESQLNIRTQKVVWPYPEIEGFQLPQVYGMAQAMASDLGLKIDLRRSGKSR